MSIVLSHTTAKAVYQAAHSVSAKGIESCSPAAIYGSCPTGTLLDAAAEWLTKNDVSLDANDSLEVMVFDRRNARYAMNCQCHVSSKRFSNSRFVELKDGIFIVDVELCALQAATYLSFRELVEYYFELCGAYSLGTDSSTSYNERFALTSTERLKQFFNSITRCDGLALARKAIQRKEGIRPSRLPKRLSNHARGPETVCTQKVYRREKANSEAAPPGFRRSSTNRPRKSNTQRHHAG